MEGDTPFIVAFGVLASICAVVVYKSHSGEKMETSEAFKPFQRNFLLVYLTLFMADWLQGPYVYALYQHYGFGKAEIARLFIVGFGSSMLFGTFVGSLADRFGRRTVTLVGALVYAASCMTKHVNSYEVLMIGRVLGGIATSVLQTVPEAWLVSEHKSHAFPDEWLSQTFQYMTFGNSVVAILAGVAASTAASTFGFVAPFDMALVLLLIGAGIVAMTWKENYGDATSTSPTSTGGILTSLRQGANVLATNSRVCLLGAVQSCFESSMYIFVFMWTPTMETSAMDVLPHGIIFATFMVSIMLGSYIFNYLMAQDNAAPESFARHAFLVGAVALIIPTLVSGLWPTYAAFCVFEGICGIYFPSAGTMRGRYVPEEVRATVMNIFRIGLNLIVVMVLLHIDDIAMDTIFFACSVLLTMAFICQHQLFVATQSNASQEARKAHGLERGEEMDDILASKEDPSQ